MKNYLRDFLVIILVSILPKIGLLSVERISSDACQMLNAGRNLFRGLGFYTSYNAYQYWPGAYYPALPFIYPIYAIVAGFVYTVFGSVDAVNFFNILISAVNAVLLYLLLLNVYQKRAIALAGVLLVAVSKSMFFTSLYPWTEQLHLLTFLSALLLLARKKELSAKLIFVSGILLGVGCLVRFASIFIVLGFVAFLLSYYKFSKKSWRLVFILIAGFSLILLSYELICYFKYGILYPECHFANRNYILASTFGGDYLADKPVIRAAVSNVWAAPWLAKANILYNLFGFLRSLFFSLNFLLPFLIIKVFFMNKNRHELLWLNIGIFALLIHPFLVEYRKLSPSLIEIDRYILISNMMFIIVTVPAVFKIVGKLKLDTKRINLLFCSCLLPTLFLSASPIIDDHIKYRQEQNGLREWKALYQELSSWFKQNTSDSDIIATSEYSSAFYIDRPIVMLPWGRMLSENKFERYLLAFKPDYIWVHKKNLYLFEHLFNKLCEPIEINQQWGSFYCLYKPKY